MINFDNKKNTPRHTKKAAKYPKLYIGFSDPRLKIKIKIDNNKRLKAIDFFE